MFDTQAQAVRKYQGLVANFPLIRKRIGTHLAQGAILPAHGVRTPMSRSGHFDLHIERGAKVHLAFQVLMVLP